MPVTKRFQPDQHLFKFIKEFGHAHKHIVDPDVCKSPVSIRSVTTLYLVPVFPEKLRKDTN
jgi:hypothetical protein